MGCRHCFVVDLVEEIVGEGGSRSFSWAHEHENFQLVSQMHVAIQTLWSQCLFPCAVWTNRWIVHFQRVSPFYLDLRLRFCLCLCLSLDVQQTNRYSCSQERERETCIDFLSTRTGRLFFHNGSPRSINWIRVWLGWSVVFCLWSNFWTQFLHPIMSQGNLRRMSRWFIFFFVYDFSSFHPNSFRGTTGWECSVKDYGVRSRLMEF